MINLFKQHIKAIKFLSCFLGSLVSIVILLMAILPSFAASADLSTGMWSGTGKYSGNPKHTASPFTMSLTIKSVHQADKIWSGILSENIYQKPVTAKGTFTHSSITFTTSLGYKYSGTLSSTTIDGKWSKVNDSTFHGTFTLHRDLTFA